MLAVRTTNHVLVTAVFGAAALFCSAAQAQDKYPSKTIEVVIHSKYGGGTDQTARTMMIDTTKKLGGEMTVVSKRGGSGSEAQAYMMSQPADGHTILALTQTHFYTIAQGKSKMKIENMVGVARAMDDPTFITVAGKSSIKTLADLIKASKEKPMNWGVAQIGGTEHVGLALFAKEAGIQYKPVAFGSGMQMVQNLMSGAIQATLPNVSEAKAQIDAGELRPLAVMSEKRLPAYPNVPTTFELGVKVATSTTRGYAVRADTPPAILKKLSDAMVAGMKEKAYSDYLKGSGLTSEQSVAGSEVWTKQIRDEYAKAVVALKELGVEKKK